MNISTILEICVRYAEENGHDFRTHCEGYCEPGYTDPESGLIVTGNWNSQRKLRRVWPIDRPDFLDFAEVDTDALEEWEDNTMPRIAAALEKAGIEIEWEDEWIECDDCYKLFRTSPDCYSWLPHFHMGDGYVTCHDCIEEDPADYLEEIEGDANHALTLSLDLEEFGYFQVGEERATGFHPGQNADPHEVASDLEKLGVTRFLFEITGKGQFDAHWQLWVHNEDRELLGEESEEPALA